MKHVQKYSQQLYIVYTEIFIAALYKIFINQKKYPSVVEWEKVQYITIVEYFYSSLKKQ